MSLAEQLTRRDMQAVHRVWEDGQTLATVAEEFATSASTISRVMSGAKAAGSLKVSIDISPLILNESRDCSKEEARLIQKFPHLGWATVVDINDQYTGKIQYRRRTDDMLHRALGLAAAKAIEPSRIQTIGVGSGRATSAFAEWSRILNKKFDSAVALCGGIPTYTTDDIWIAPSPSSDQVALLLASTWEQSELDWKARASLTPSLPPYDQRQYMPDEEYGVIDCVVFGVGSLSPEFDYPKNEWRMLQASGVIKDTAKAWQIAETLTIQIRDYLPKIESPTYYNPIGECLNFLHIIPMPPQVKTHQYFQSWMEQLQEEVDAINKTVIGPFPDELRSVPMRMAIAGGAQKLFPIYHTLHTGLANWVVTDKATAELLLAL